ncbi:TPA: DTW domain-containing protein [Vibrio vulnificus]|nr:DTW domain-containing protein [Vibrio vulnificus]
MSCERTADKIVHPFLYLILFMRIHAFHRLYQYRQSISTKPFHARGCNIKRCVYCQVVETHCLCEFQPNIETDVACMLIVSDNEVFKPSNTGRLIADTVKETYVYQWNRTEPDPHMLALLNDANYRPVIVFPADYVDDASRLIDIAKVSQQAQANGDKVKWLFVFLDGSWREARKIFRRSEFLQSLPVLSVSPEHVSEYLMRRSENEQHLSTVEVASLVLQQAGQQEAADCLQAWFQTFRESYLLSKSRGKGDVSRPALQHFITHYKSESSL